MKEKDLFEAMVNDWKADHEESENLEIGEVYWDDDLESWAADAEDEKSTYLLSDDGTGNVRLDYVGTK